MGKRVIRHERWASETDLHQAFEELKRDPSFEGRHRFWLLFERSGNPLNFFLGLSWDELTGVLPASTIPMVTYTEERRSTYGPPQGPNEVSKRLDEFVGYVGQALSKEDHKVMFKGNTITHTYPGDEVMERFIIKGGIPDQLIPQIEKWAREWVGSGRR